jgi:hypothetical protein
VPGSMGSTSALWEAGCTAECIAGGLLDFLTRPGLVLVEGYRGLRGVLNLTLHPMDQGLDFIKRVGGWGSGRVVFRPKLVASFFDSARARKRLRKRDKGVGEGGWR